MHTSSPTRSFGQRVSDQLLRLRRTFPFAANVALLSGGASFGHCFTLAASPILARLYLPREIGDLGMFSAFLGVAAVAVSLQYDVAIVSAENEQQAAHLAMLSVAFALPMSTAGGFLLYGMIHRGLFGFGGLPEYAAWLMIPCLFFAAFFSVLRYWSLRSEQFGTVSQGLLFQNGGRSVLQVALGFFGTHSFGLLIGETLGRALGMSRMLRRAWPVIRSYPPTRSGAANSLKQHRCFPFYSLPSSLLNMVGTSLPLPLLVTLYGMDAGGYYSLVWRVLAVPVVLVGASMADAFHSQVALYARNQPERLLPFFHKSTISLLLIGAIPAIVIFCFGQPIFALAFGSKWRLSGAMAAIVAPWFLTSFVVSPLSRLVYVLRGQRLKLIYDIVVLGGNVVVFLVARQAHWPMLRMIAGMSIMNTASKVIYYLVLLRLASTRDCNTPPTLSDVVSLSPGTP
jgi:lipopolysaccharide exporter